MAVRHSGGWVRRFARAGWFMALCAAAIPLVQAASVDDEDRQEIEIRRSNDGKPRCVDTPAPDPEIRLELMPVHEAIGRYIAHQDTPARFGCATQSFEYHGERTSDQVRVQSNYRGTRQVHAEVFFAFDKREQNYKRQGVMRSFWRNGKPQSLEYFCHNFPVGFHRYFDRSGKLVAVIDFTRSDYAYGKTQSDTHKFLVERPWGTGALASTDSAWTQAQWFREVFRIESDEARRVQFHVGSMGGDWRRVAATLRVDDWTTLGKTSSFVDRGGTYLISNRDFGYESLAELYLRKRAGESFENVRAATPQVLECPILDEAMSLGLEDSRFAFAPLKGTRPLSIDQLAIRCLESPTVDCLIQVSQQGNRRLSGALVPRELNLARTAIQIGRADLARELLTPKPEELAGYRIPSPLFTERFALRAQAERALGLANEVGSSLAEARQAATTNTNGYEGRVPAALGEAAIALARDGRISEAQATHAELAGRRPEIEIVVRREIALAFARMGDEKGARLAMTPASTTQVAAPPQASGLSPFLGMEIATAQFLRGDTELAMRSLTRFRHLVVPPSPPAPQGIGNEVFARLVGAMARSGQTAQAMRLVESVPRFSSGMLETAAELCASGLVTEGLALAVPARTQASPDANADVIRRASLALVDARCGRRDEARKEFQRALSDAAKLGDPPSDEIGESSASQVTDAIVRRMMAAGLFDDIPSSTAIDSLGDARGIELDLAVARARAGLDAVAPTAIPLGDRHSGRTVQRIALARAEILARQRAPGAATELARTRQLALTHERDSDKALNLAIAANLLIDLGDERTARKWLEEAFAIALRTRSRLQADHFDPLPIARPSTEIARGFARIGDYANAERMNAEVEAGHLPAQEVPDLDRVYGELSLAKARAGDARGAANYLRQIKSPALRTLFLSKAATSSATLSPLWADVMTNLDATFAASEDALTRRRLVHVLLTQAGGGSALRDELRQQVPFIADESLRARASCELAAAYRAAGDEPSAKLSWALSAEGRSSDFKAPDAVGACAAWLRLAGEPEAAAARLRKHYAQLAQGMAGAQFMTMDTYSTWFRELALVQYESEHGEMFPEEGWFLVP